MTTCALCLKEKDLINSHILPEFLYKPMYDKKHNYLIVSTDSEKQTRKKPKGIYERLLCKECDSTIIGQYEDYAAKVLFGDGSTEITIQNIDLGFLISDLDYSLFKLFQMSLLWRVSVSNRPEFKNVDLGPHNDRIRQLLLNMDPGEIYEYGCIIYFIPNQPKEMIGFIYPPEPIPSKVMGRTWYRAIFNGLFWTYIVSKESNTFSQKKLFLQDNGVLPIINSGNKGMNFLSKLAEDLVKSKPKL